MTDPTRRRRYRYDRIVIEKARILDAQFDDAVLFFTGAQIELMRNMTEYLRRLETYCSDYHLGYYLTPTPEDYDSLMAIVASLEETLMGNPNTLFGYKGTKHLDNSTTVSGAGLKQLSTGTVPADELWRMETYDARNEDTVCSRIQLLIGSGTGSTIVHEVDNPGADELVQWTGLITLPPGASLIAKFYDCADGDKIKMEARGYTMAIPD